MRAARDWVGESNKWPVDALEALVKRIQVDALETAIEDLMMAAKTLPIDERGPLHAAVARIHGIQKAVGR
jgi:hypothetical protein